MPNSIISIAPMLDLTDRHCRYLHRLLTRKTLLYTEMITAEAILYGDRKRLLAYHPAEHPVALQLGGSEPTKLAASAQIGADFGYDEINLNVGCPSSRVQAGKFGACLMLQPELVAECVAAMATAVKLPISVKMRLGVDDHDSYDELVNFVRSITCEKIIVHARKACLASLSPHQNRTIPPLDYAKVWQLKQDFPQLTVIVNGGLNSHAAIRQQLQQVDGVMIGREAYKNPYFLATFDQRYYHVDYPPKTREQVLMEYLPYMEQQLAQGTPRSALIRPILGLFYGIPGGRAWRRELCTDARSRVSTIFYRIFS